MSVIGTARRPHCTCPAVSLNRPSAALDRPELRPPRIDVHRGSVLDPSRTVRKRIEPLHVGRVRLRDDRISVPQECLNQPIQLGD